MILSIGLENGMDGRSLAWALEHPGCYADGPDGKAALAAVPGAFREYRDWIAVHTPGTWLAGDNEYEVRLDETFQAYDVDRDLNRIPSGSGIEINAWFLHDWKPLNGEEIDRGLLMLKWAREDLLAAVAGLSPQQLDATRPGERWSIRGILGHVATAEGWYLSRLGLIDGTVRANLPEDVFARLALVRARLEEVLPGLEGSKQVVGVQGEIWSPRKLLRRALWHERDHTRHIVKLR